MWRAGWAGADGGRLVGKCQGGSHQSRARAVEPGRLPGPNTLPLLKHLWSAAVAAPGEVRDPLRNLTEEEDEGRGRH